MQDKIKQEKLYMEKSWKKEAHQSYKSQQIDDSIKNFVHFLKSKKITGTLLDLGCGNGKNSFYFQNNSFNSTGIDFTKSAINICKQNSQNLDEKLKPTFLVRDVLDLKFSTKFDIIIDCGCLHHIRRSYWNKYKTTIFNNLKDGGYYYVHGISNSEENKRFPKHPKKRNWIINKKGHYTTFFSESDIPNLLGKNFNCLKTYDFKSFKSPLMVKVFYFQKKN
jgi:cyclopropane fatty-acyl-phospholipid synthase-like methyltransferase